MKSAARRASTRPRSQALSSKESVPPNGDAATSHFITVLLVLAIGLVAALLVPFLTAFFGAAVLAGVLHPLQLRFAARLGGRQYVAAALLTLAVVLVVVVPLVLVSMSVVDEAARWEDWFATTAREQGVEGLVAPVPEPLRPAARAVLRAMPRGVISMTIGEGVEPAADPAALADPTGAAAPASDIGSAAGVMTNVVAGIARALVSLGILIVALYFLLADGQRLIQYLLDLFPLANRKSRAILSSFREISVAVLLSTFVTALIQTGAAWIGFVIAGVPSVALMLFVTFLMAFVPVIGATGVVTAAGIVLWASGSVGLGIFLTAWGLLVVGLIDNLVKPMLVRGRTTLAGGVVFFAMVCGLALFGLPGIVAGPLIVTFFMAVARLASQQPPRPAVTA